MRWITVQDPYLMVHQRRERDRGEQRAKAKEHQLVISYGYSTTLNPPTTYTLVIRGEREKGTSKEHRSEEQS